MVRSPVRDGARTVTVEHAFVPWLIAGLDQLIDDMPPGAQLPPEVVVGLADLRRLVGPAGVDDETSWADCREVAAVMGVTERQARRLAASWEPFGAERTDDGWRVPRAVLEEHETLRSLE